MSPNKALAKSRQRLLRTLVFDSGHLQHECERPDMERKYLSNNKAQRIDPKLTTIISEMCGATNIQNNQACILQNYKSLSETLAKPELLCTTTKNFMPSKIPCWQPLPILRIVKGVRFDLNAPTFGNLQNDNGGSALWIKGLVFQCCHCCFFFTRSGVFLFFLGFWGFSWKSGFFWLWSNFRNICCITVFSIRFKNTVVSFTVQSHLISNQHRWSTNHALSLTKLFEIQWFTD